MKKNPIPVKALLRLIFVQGLCLLFSQLTAQRVFAQYYPQDDFRAPLDTPLFLSAPFGSLRDNHFHSGMDIRTYEHEGLPVYAAADGYISRIKFSTVGYGKALYIDHPNGYTTVYGHLQRCEGEIADYIKRYQYHIESYEFDHFPGRALHVKKGQIIGYSGNSGGSTGPHLHFEVRSTRTEEPLNPQLFGIPVVDLYEPSIKKVMIYNLDRNRPQLLNDIAVSKNRLQLRDSTWYYPDTVDVAAGTVGFAAEAYDYMTNPGNEYSIYGLDAFFDQRQIYGFRLDRISFADSRSINVHIDYQLYKEDGIRFQKCFLDDGNRIRIYNFIKNKGKIKLDKNGVHELRLVAYDFSGRSFRLVVPMRGFADVASVLPPLPCRTATFYPGRDNIFRTRDVIVEVPAKALYDTLDFCLDVESKDKYPYSPTFKVHDMYTPLNRNMSVSIRATNIPPGLEDKMLLAYYAEHGNVRSAGGEFKDGWVSTRSTSFGNYFISVDTVAPVIRLLNVNAENVVRDSLGLRVYASDNFSGVSSWKATLNGKWTLAEYDPKSNTLICPFDKDTPRNTKLSLLLVVSDRKGNNAAITKEIVIAD